MLSPPMREAALFADAALRRVLEVIDRRRPLAQLRLFLTASLVDSVLALHPTDRATAAMLRRVRVQPVAVDDRPASAAEAFGTYSRGPRIHAVACRVARGPTGWRVVALHIG